MMPGRNAGNSICQKRPQAPASREKGKAHTKWPIPSDQYPSLNPMNERKCMKSAVPMITPGTKSGRMTAPPLLCPPVTPPTQSTNIF